MYGADSAGGCAEGAGGGVMGGYPEIAEYFEAALDGIDPPAAFAGAIRAMKLKPELCERISCFDDTLWKIIQDYLNGGGAVKDEDCFIHAARLLERRASL